MVHVLNGSAAARRDSFAPGRLDNVRIVAFFRRHRKDNRFRFNDFAFVDIVFVDLSAKPRHHRHKFPDAAHLLHAFKLIQVILQSERVGLHLLLKFQRFFFRKRFLRLFDKRQNVAHAKDSACHTVGIERLDIFHLFAAADEFYGFARHRFYRKRRAAAGIAVEFRDDDARDVEFLVESFRNVDGVLSRHAVDDKKNFVGGYFRFDFLQFFHQLFVDVKSSRRVDDKNVRALPFRLVQSVFRNLYGVDLPFFKNGNVDFPADDLQLLYCRGTIYVARRKHDFFVLFFQHPRKFSAHCGFARALKTAHHNDCRGSVRHRKFAVRAAHKRDKFVIDDFYNLLRAVKTFQDIFARGFFGHSVDKIPYDLKVYVRFKQRDSDFTHCLLDFKVGQFAFFTHFRKNVIQFFRQTVECHITPPKARRRRQDAQSQRRRFPSSRLPLPRLSRPECRKTFR